METNKRDYSSISPSAKVLLLMKGLTNIPYAKQLATLMTDGETTVPVDIDTLLFRARVLHFENRYLSIDQLLDDEPAKNILELSSGFSFRGLDRILNHDCHYIDTDLPDVIATKRHFMDQLLPPNQEEKGTLEMLPLNAMDEADFTAIINRFNEAEIAIVNEGLLMYLSVEEKIKLCKTIREALQQKGGYWITADIYIKREMHEVEVAADDSLNRFFEQHRIRENMFDSFEAAEDFFKEQGFFVDKEAKVDGAQLTALAYFRQKYTEEQRAIMEKAPKIQATWRLKLA